MAKRSIRQVLGAHQFACFITLCVVIAGAMTDCIDAAEQ